jgi:hypothetical protein
MKTIANERGNRVVELTSHESRSHAYFERLLDEGWDVATAQRYAERRFGVLDPAFVRWTLS